MSKKKSVSKREALREIWSRGDLDYKRHPGQLTIKEYIKNDKRDIIPILASRRLGKSFELIMEAVEMCVTDPHSMVKYVCPQLKMVKEIVLPNMRIILEDCPVDMKPEWKENDKKYIFPNGSEIKFAGTDNGSHESLRGGSSTLCIVDEAGFCDHLDYVVYSILAPTTDTTDGKIILISTPSKSSSHEFITKFINPSKAAGTLLTLNIHDNPMLTDRKKEAIAARFARGVEDTQYRREYLCEILSDDDSVVIPEFTEKLRGEIVREWDRPPFFDTYVSGDVGFKDLTVYLFAYWDFLNAKLIIEDELVMNGPSMTTEALASNIKAKEAELFSDDSGIPLPIYMRVMDNNLIMINDLQRLHGLNFLATAKDNKEAQINALRMMISNKQIIINPRCKHLIYHLQSASWDKNHKAFIRVGDSPDMEVRGGHSDACFIPGTKVLTSSGMVSIEDISSGDMVLTHKGRYRKVIHTMNKEYSGSVIKIKPTGRSEIICTPDHRFYNSISYKNRDGIFTGQKFLHDPEWSSASKLVPYENHLYIPNIEQGHIEESLEMCFLYGYYVAEGSLSGNNSGVCFAGHQKEVNVLGIIERAVHGKYGTGYVGTSRRSLARHKKGTHSPKKTKIRVYNRKYDNGRSAVISDKTLWNDLRALGKSTDKHFPEFICDLDRTQALYMLSGYLFGDGHFAKVGVKANTISLRIRDGVDVLARKLGLVGNFTTQNKFPNNLQHWWSLDKQQTQGLLNMVHDYDDLSFIFQDKLIHELDIKNNYHHKPNFRKLSSVTVGEYSGLVYNLEVEEDNSYTTEGVAVHNCDAAIYLVRNIVRSKNPYPETWGTGNGTNMFKSKLPQKDSGVADKIKTILNIKKK